MTGSVRKYCHLPSCLSTLLFLSYCLLSSYGLRSCILESHKRFHRILHLSSNAANNQVPTDIPTTTATTTSDGSGSSEAKPKQLMGDWEQSHGNYVLRPPRGDPPRALLHFLGGALVGAVPHVSYRYMLERLANQGYLVVATPYNLSFDHLETCDVILTKFEEIAPMLARQYGALPVVGVGHSCGALLQLLITSLFPDTPRAANALMSFNNKPVKEAVPFFEEVFAPLFVAAANRNGTLPSGLDGINLALKLARTFSEGDLPSDALLSEVSRYATPSFLLGMMPQDLVVPEYVRQSLETLVAPSSQALSTAGVTPLLNDVVDTLDQIPLLMQEVAMGARDFIPPPASVRAAARRAYRARRTLVLEFDQDALDESSELIELLREAESVTRMKRPMIPIDVQRRKLPGGHATPLLAPPLEVTSRAEDLLGKDMAKDRLLYTQADATVEELVKWLEAGSL